MNKAADRLSRYRRHAREDATRNRRAAVELVLNRDYLPLETRAALTMLGMEYVPDSSQYFASLYFNEAVVYVYSGLRDTPASWSALGNEWPPGFTDELHEAAIGILGGINHG